MRLGVMQPYAFPYLGYFQLINAVDLFVAYDDVNFIKQGWINRNQIVLNGSPFLFTIPLKDASSFRKIGDVSLDANGYPLWQSKFCRTLTQAYSKAPYFKTVYPLLEKILSADDQRTISELAIDGLKGICNYLDIRTQICTSTNRYHNEELCEQQRILDICRQEQADHYINAIGGQHLYDYASFREKGLQLQFIKTQLSNYHQFNNQFIGGMSMIDILMHNSVEEIKQMLNNYELIRECGTLVDILD